MDFGGCMLTALFVYAAAAAAVAEASFKCNTEGATCNGLVGYVSPNATTLSRIQSFFGVNSLPSLLGANNLPLSTPSSQSVAVNQTVKIPFQCLCSNGTGRPKQRRPVYKVVKDDGLWHIAAEVFSGLVTSQQIQTANNISDPNLILIGQELWIPLPCSCDELEGQRVVHYGHAVKSGSTLAEIAQQYNTTEDTLLTLNDLPSPKALLADTPLDVPVKACASKVGNDSLDYPLLVANGTYTFTAGDCVTCKCDATNNWTLHCDPSSQVNSSLWKTCPSMQCEDAGNSYQLGNFTSSGCNRTTCSYTGYTNQTILTTLASESTCPASNKSASKFSMQAWNWSYLLVSIHLVVLGLHVVY